MPHRAVEERKPESGAAAADARFRTEGKKIRLPSSPSACRCPATRSFSSRAFTSSPRLSRPPRLPPPRPRPPHPRRIPCWHLVRRRRPQRGRMSCSSLVPLPPAPRSWHVPVSVFHVFLAARIPRRLRRTLGRQAHHLGPTHGSLHVVVGTRARRPVREFGQDGVYVEVLTSTGVLGSRMARSTGVGRTTREKIRWWWTGRA
ncbi:hypothetical protein C8R45DRAFT_293133 [Mycena sanguinolenta]|nr:hypothetical protein C8R45DRAFT_293133 [Mycena sanguinolenta]